jgi:di/tricarboxylate transporter
MFAWGRWRYDMVALATLLAATVAGTVPFADAFAGFGHPATVTVVFVLIISRGLTNSGAVDLIARHLLPPVESASAHVGILTGTAGALVAVTGGLPAAAMLTALLVLTMLLSCVINNAATAVVMAPIAAGIAQQLGASADPFLMAVAVGASAAFLTPIGHQNNTLIMGPGGYHFGDYWRMGLPLSIVVAAVAVPMLLWVWPL